MNDEVRIWYDPHTTATKGNGWRARSTINGTQRISRITYTQPDTPARDSFELGWRQHVLRLRQQTPDPNNIYTIGDLCNWLSQNPPTTWGKGHTASMRSINRRQIQPYPIAGRPFREAIPAWFHRHINGIDGASKQTRQHTRQYLYTAYRAAALQEDHLHRPWWEGENPLTPVSVETGATPIRRVIPTADQTTVLLQYMSNGQPHDMLRAGIAMAWTGCRPSEWCALEWADINFGDRSVDVSKAVKAGTQDVGDTKTWRGARLTFMPAVTAAVMAEWRDYVGGDRFVFPHVGRSGFEYGRPATPGAFAKALRRAKGRDGLLSVLPDDLTLYGIRHLQVSRLTAGMSPGEAASVAGHSPSMSIDHYTQALGTGARAAEIWDVADSEAMG